MKKNVMMRVASALLVAVLLSTCAISGTFAKYVTTASGTDTARVAHFGVVITANGNTFANTYETDNASVKGTIANSVVGKEGADVIAPGTTGSLTAMTLSGIPEVAVNVEYVADLTLTNWVLGDGTTEYCPVYFTIGTGANAKTYGTTHTSLGLDYEYDTVAELETAVENAIADYSENYAPHTDLSVESTVGTPDVVWTWAFDNGDDSKDTWLGNAAAAGNYATIALTVTTTVTQID